MSGPYPHAGEYPAQNERCGIHGVSERQEQPDDLPKMGQYEICVPQPRILVQGKEYIANQLKQDKEADQLSIFDPRDPFTGSK